MIATYLRLCHEINKGCIQSVKTQPVTTRRMDKPLLCLALQRFGFEPLHKRMPLFIVKPPLPSEYDPEKVHLWSRSRVNTLKILKPSFLKNQGMILLDELPISVGANEDVDVSIKLEQVFINAPFQIQWDEVENRFGMKDSEVVDASEAGSGSSDAGGEYFPTVFSRFCGHCFRKKTSVKLLKRLPNTF